MKIITQKILLWSLALLLILNSGMANAQWNTNTSQNLLISGLTIGDMQAASTSTSDGKLWVAFYHPNGGNYDMRAQLFDANGNKMLGPDGMLVSNQPTGTATFVFNVCVDNLNNLIIGCQDQRSGSMQAVLYKISQAGTHLWSSTGVVLGGGLAPYPAALTNNDIIVGWVGDVTIQLQKVTAAGTLAWAIPIPVTVGGSNTTRGQIVANLNNHFTMVYQKNAGGISTNLYAQKFNSDGVAQYAPLQICNQTTAGYRYYSIKGEDDVTYFGYYSSTGQRFNSFLQRINPDGTIPWGMNGSAFNTSTGTNDNYQGTTYINLTPGSPYVWSVCTFSDPNQTKYGVYVQKFLKTSGARQFTDQGKAVYPITTAANNMNEEGNLQLSDDLPMFMTYDNAYKLYVTKLDATGNFVWPYSKAEISSTTATLGSPKGRYDFRMVGANRLAGIWTEDRGSGEMGYIQGISKGGLFGLDVITQGSVPAIINTGNGTLQMESVVYPSYANQLSNWSIIPVTGMANINSTGLVTAVSDGTVWAKAIAIQDNTIMDSLLITITNQVPVPPDVVTLPANNIAWYSATLNGTVDANYFNSAATFEWGLTAAYGNTATATPSQATGGNPTPVSANLTGLTHSTTYHFRCKGVNSAGTAYGQDLTFTTDCYLAGTIGTITGTSALCVNTNNVNYSIPAFTGATGYNWTVPAGATIVAGNNTNSIDVDFSAAAQSGNITVTATNGACYSTTSDPFAVTVSNVPVAPGSIVGNQIVCEGDQGIVYTVPPITDATNYIWSVPTGVVITAGSNTNSITVTFGAGSTSGNITVYGTNSCGTGDSSAPLTVDVAPLPGTVGAITGPTQICAEADNIIYSVSPVTNAYGYVWTLSPGAQLVSGANTNQITVTFTPSATSGNFTVYATNGNCMGQTSPALAVSVNPTPATPVITQHVDTLFSSADAGNQWYLDGVLIPGATAKTHVAVYAGNYSVVVTLNGCSSASSNSILVLPVSVSDVKLVNSLEIYPNPNEGQFEIKATSDKLIVCSIEIYDNIGRIIWKQDKVNISGASITHIDLKNVPVGSYLVVLRNSENRIFRKMAINR